MKKIGLILFSALLLWNLSACGASSRDETKKAVIKDDRLVVTLESNPSTGYGWAYTAEGDPCFPSVAEYAYTSPQHELNLAGASGTEIFIFTPEADGEAQLHFAYLRSFEENSTIREFDLRVSVSAGKLRILDQKYTELS